MKIGYRGWRVTNVDGLLTLCSPHQKFCWQPGENLAVPEDAHLDEHNTYGFYALKSPEAVFEYFYRNSSKTYPISIDIIGEALLYGDVVEGENGYRGARAQVGTLLLPTIEKFHLELIERLCFRYDVQFSVTAGHTRHILEMYRNMKARGRLALLTGGGRRCTAGGRAIAEIRKDEFLL